MQMQLEEIAGTVTKASLNGKLDVAGALAIDMAFSVLVGSRRAIVVDLSNVSFMASMGLRTLVMGAKTVSSKGGRMVLLSPTPDVAKVLADSGIDTLIPIYGDLASAAAAVGGTP
jgi:anti-anti-sigma factor